MVNKLLVYPTDTVWGIGSSLKSKELTQKVLRIKNIEDFRPFSIMFSRVEQIKEYFDLPDFFEGPWLKKFFELESTLLVPEKWSKTPIGTWINGDSKHVGIRCLSFPEIDLAYEMNEGPFTSTSLNITGQAPIEEDLEARKFFDQNCPDEIFIERNQLRSSGSSSTVFMFNESSEHKILREGRYINEILEHIKLLILALNKKTE